MLNFTKNKSDNKLGIETINPNTATRLLFVFGITGFCLKDMGFAIR